MRKKKIIPLMASVLLSFCLIAETAFAGTGMQAEGTADSGTGMQAEGTADSGTGTQAEESAYAGTDIQASGITEENENASGKVQYIAVGQKIKADDILPVEGAALLQSGDEKIVFYKDGYVYGQAEGSTVLYALDEAGNVLESKETEAGYGFELEIGESAELFVPEEGLEEYTLLEADEYIYELEGEEVNGFLDEAPEITDGNVTPEITDVNEGPAAADGNVTPEITDVNEGPAAADGNVTPESTGMNEDPAAADGNEDEIYTWEVSDNTVLSADNNIVTALLAGESEIYAYYSDGSLAFEWKCIVPKSDDTKGEVTDPESDGEKSEAGDPESDSEEPDVGGPESDGEKSEAGDPESDGEKSDAGDPESDDEKSEAADPGSKDTDAEEADPSNTETEKNVKEKTPEAGTKTKEEGIKASEAVVPDGSMETGVNSAAEVVDGGMCGPNMSWKYYRDGTLEILGTGEMYNYGGKVAPWRSGYTSYQVGTVSKIKIGKGVTSIGEYAFFDMGSVTSVSIPSTVTSIGKYAFFDCRSLGYISLPSGLRSLGAYSFQYCTSLKQIIFPNDLIEIPEQSFTYCYALERIVLPDNLKTIGAWAFYNCGLLNNVGLPDTLTSVGDAAFAGCASLSSLIVPSGINSIGGSAFTSCSTIYYTGNSTRWNATGGPGSIDPSRTTVKFGSAAATKLSACAIAFKDVTTMYTGKPLKKPVIIKNGSTVLKENTDYILVYSNYTNAGKATVRIMGIGKYSGRETRSYVIAKRPVTTATVTGLKTLVYTGAALKPLPKVKITIGKNTFTLKNKKDYTLSYKNNKNAGTATVIITGKGNYKGTLSKKFTIQAKSITKAAVSNVKNKQYTGKAIKQSPKVVITLGNKNVTLKSGRDYSLSYKNNVNLGVATLTIKGKGNYRGSIKKTFRVTASIKKAKVTGIKGKLYTGGNIGQSPVVRVTVGSKTYTLKKGRDYTITYTDNVSVGRATMVIKGKGNFTGSIKKYFKISARSIKTASVSGVKNLVYTGKARTQSPTVTIKIGSRTLTLGGNSYTISYKNNVKVGTATMIITAKGNFYGTLKKTFKIVKAKPVLKFAKSSVSKGLKSSAFTIKLTKKTDGKVTFSSSNTSVAKINKTTGKVTITGVGKATIKANAAAGKNYKAGSASYKLTVKSIGLSDLSYSFGNNNNAYGYSSNYVIPLYIYQKIFSGKQAQLIYQVDSRVPWGGNCFGMSSTSILFNNKGSGLNRSAMNVSGSLLSTLSTTSYSSEERMNLREIIETMQISQYDDNIQKCYNENKDLNRVCKAVISGVKQGKLPIVSMVWNRNGNRSGHSTVGYKISNINSSEDWLYIYDPNFPMTERHITLYKNNTGYTGWEYFINDNTYVASSQGDTVDYTNYAAFQPIWKNKSAYSTEAQKHVSVNNFEIYDSSGNRVAYVEDGELTSTTDEIYQFQPLSGTIESVLLYMPAEEYTIVNTEKDTDQFEVSTVHVDQMVTVTTTSDSVTINVNDESEVCEVVIDAEEGETYEVVVESDLPSAEGHEEVMFSGEGNGEALKVGTEDGALILDNAEGTLVSINGEEAFEAA